MLEAASDEQLQEVTVEVNGRALRWENFDADLSVEGVVADRFRVPLEV
jgi:hypothetical protein